MRQKVVSFHSSKQHYCYQYHWVYVKKGLLKQSYKNISMSFSTVIIFSLNSLEKSKTVNTLNWRRHKYDKTDSER